MAEFKRGDYVRFKHDDTLAGRITGVVTWRDGPYTFLVRSIKGVVEVKHEAIEINPDGERDEWIALQMAEARAIVTYRDVAQIYNGEGAWIIAWEAKQAYKKLLDYMAAVERELKK